MLCKHCKSNILRDDTFCVSCGNFHDFNDIPSKNNNDLIKRLADLVIHCHFYAGSKDCGIDRMSPDLRDLYMKVLRGDFN